MKAKLSKEVRLIAVVLTAVAGSGVAMAQGSVPLKPGGQTPMLAAAAGQGTSSPVKDDLFAGTEKFAKGASDVTEVTMDPDTLDMVGGKNANRAHDMVLNVVRSYQYDKPGMYNIADVEEIRQRLNTGDWHCSVHTADLKHGESTDVCRKHRTDGLLEQAIITVEPKQLTFIHTIRRSRVGGGDDSLLMLPGGAPWLAGTDEEMSAQMAVMQARLQAGMPNLEALTAQLQRQLEPLLPMVPTPPTPPMP